MAGFPLGRDVEQESKFRRGTSRVQKKPGEFLLRTPRGTLRDVGRYRDRGATDLDDEPKALLERKGSSVSIELDGEFPGESVGVEPFVERNHFPSGT